VPRDAWLVISSAAGLSAVPLPLKLRIVIGRKRGCDILIEDESVSREHAVLHNEVSGLTIEDLGSRNKTRVMGRSLKPGEVAALGVGTVVEIGHATILVQVGRPPSVKASPPTPPSPSPHVGAASAVVVDATMQGLYALLDVIAPSSLNVLVLGETGTGKEVFTEAIHNGSARARGPLLRINCAGLSGSLLESELFGHEKGSFTGATSAKAGLFEAADGGTLFLDEVGELPLDTQSKLLRVVERGEVTRLGSVTPRRVDVRYVAATNRDLQQLIAEQRFRSDLFFRLNGFSMTLPPLRKRKKEIVPLARFFLGRVALRGQYILTPLAEQALENHPWPGNVRELKNVVERALVLCGPLARIDVEHLHLPDAALRQEHSYDAGSATNAGDLKARRESWEHGQILGALTESKGNQRKAAKLLGISRRTLINKIEAYGIARPRKR
jgi:two-component system response regulator AtoC